VAQEYEEGYDDGPGANDTGVSGQENRGGQHRRRSEGGG
jgi:hypothetical protein